MFNTLIFLAFLGREQPPSRGCVLKPLINVKNLIDYPAAAFARLCVETVTGSDQSGSHAAAAFARLCVETAISPLVRQIVVKQPPSRGCVLKHHCTRGGFGLVKAAAFARLCVETLLIRLIRRFINAAAFARLCVETQATPQAQEIRIESSRLRAAVC